MTNRRFKEPLAGRQAIAPGGGGRRRSRLLWGSLLCVAAVAAVAYAAEYLALPDDGAEGLVATSGHAWLFFVLIAGLVLLVARVAARANVAAVMEGESSYRYLFESCPLPMWVMEEGTWRILEANDAAVERYGYSREEFARLSALDLQVAEDREKVAQDLRERDPRAVAHFRRRHRTASGEILLADVAARPFLFRGRAARVILVNDVTTRVRAEEELQQSDERYRDLFNHSPIPMWVYDKETLRFLAVNDAAVRRYGYSREEFGRLTIADLHLPENVPGVLERVRRRGPNDYFEHHVQHRNRSGAIIEVDIRSGPIVFGGRLARQVLGHDITDRVRMEQALREGEERLRTIADNVPALIGYVDSEHRYRFANRAFEDWFGVPARSVAGCAVRDVLGEAQYAEILPDLERALSGHDVAVERPLSGANGRDLYARISYIPHSDRDGRVSGVYVLGYDMTERRRGEEALARERALLRAVIDNLPDNIYAKDRDLRYLLVNPAGLAVRGASRLEDVIGRTAADFYPASAAAFFDSEDRRVIDEGVALVNRERNEMGADGERRVYQSTKVPLRDGDGNVVGIVGLGRDITELRRSAETIERLNAELEERVLQRTAELEAANKELEAFSYSVSHDLRAPLRSIEGFSRALAEDYAHRLDAAGRDFLSRIIAASQRMGELIEDLLSLSRVTRTEMARMPVNLSSVAEEIAAELKKGAGKRRVRFTIEPGLVVCGDPNLLRLALENLLANAWKFSAGNPRSEVELGVIRTGDQPAYFVRDNGVGFDMAYAGRLFRAFQRLHGSKEFPGTGVGLATVHRIIMRHGGKVWAESEPGKGAVFYFTVP